MYYVCKRKISGEIYASSFHSHLPLKHQNVAMLKKSHIILYIAIFKICLAFLHRAGYYLCVSIAE